MLLTSYLQVGMTGSVGPAIVPSRNAQTPDASIPQSTASTSVDDLELRFSEYRKVDTPEIVDFLQQELLPELLPDENDTALVRNEVMHIKDIESGFIKSHHDHRSLTSVSLEESPPLYTALICITPTRESTTQANHGVYAAAQKAYTHGEETFSTAATTPGGVLIFRKVCSRS